MNAVHAPTQPKLLSIMIPTRDRFDKLVECIGNFVRQIGPNFLREIEILIKFDSDDKASLHRLSELDMANLPIKIIIADKLGGYKDLFHFYNALARISTGTFLMMWNDDANFKTEEWYTIFRNRLAQEKGAASYWFAGTPSMVQSPGQPARVEDWPCFIAHHRLLYNIIGFYGHVGGVDSFLYYVLGPLGLLKKFEDIHVNHLAWFQIPEKERDTTAHANAADGAMLPTDFKVVEECQRRIKEYVERQQSQPKTLNQL